MSLKLHTPLVLSAMALFAIPPAWSADVTVWLFNHRTSTLVTGASLSARTGTTPATACTAGTTAGTYLCAGLANETKFTLTATGGGLPYPATKDITTGTINTSEWMRFGLPPGGELARVIFGGHQAAAASAKRTYHIFFDFFLDRPLAFKESALFKQDADLGPAMRAWGNFRIASVPQPGNTLLKDLNLANTASNLKVNELAQSVEFRGGINLRLTSTTKYYTSFDRNAASRFSLELLTSIGAITPLEPGESISPVYLLNDSGRTAYGLAKSHYFDPDTLEPLRRFPLVLDLAYGFDEAVTGGRIHGGVASFEGFYSLPSTWLSTVYLFGTVKIKPTRANEQDYILLETAPSTVKASDAALVTLRTGNRDYYRIGIGLDITRLVTVLQHKGQEPK